VELDRGWLNLPEHLHMDFYGFSAELTQMGFGRRMTTAIAGLASAVVFNWVADLGLGAQFDGLARPLECRRP